MAKRKTVLTGLQFRETSHTGIIHIFDVIGYNPAKKPICRTTEGPFTYPLNPEEVGHMELKGRFCKRCMGGDVDVPVEE